MTYDIFLLGPPGAGKSTQAARLADRLGLPCATTASELPSGGCVLDGEPRTLETARAVHETLAARRRAPDVVLLDLPDELAVRRLARRTGPFRAGASRRRFAEYKASIGPVVAFFDPRLMLHRVDASGTPDEVGDAIGRIIGLPPLPPRTPLPAADVAHVQAMVAMAAAYGYLPPREND